MVSVSISSGHINSVGEVHKIVSIGSATGEPGIHISSLPCPKVNDKGLTKGWKILDGLAKAAALLASARALQAARQQTKIARTYYKLAEHQWNFYKDHYVPLEMQELDEVHKDKPYKADYVAAIKGHDCTEPIFDSTEDHRDKIFSEYCVCVDEVMAVRYNIAMATVKGDTINFARRYAENLAERKDDVRWNKKLQVASRGRNLLPQSSEFANKASSLFGHYSNAMSGLAGDAMSFSGYIRNRQETMFNPQRSPGIYRITDPRYASYTGHNIDGSSRITAPEVAAPTGYNSSTYSQFFDGSGSSSGSTFYADPVGLGGGGSTVGYNGSPTNYIDPNATITVTEFNHTY